MSERNRSGLVHVVGQDVPNMWRDLVTGRVYRFSDFTAGPVDAETRTREITALDGAAFTVSDLFWQTWRAESGS